MSRVREKRFSPLLWICIIVLGLSLSGLAGCGGGGGGGGDDDDGATAADRTNTQRAAPATQSVGMSMSATTDVIIDAMLNARGVRSDRPTTDFNISKIVDLDTVDGDGNDVVPTGTGQLKFAGAADFAGDAAAGTVTIDDLTMTCLTDVTFTDPESGASITYAEGSQVSFAVSATYTYNGDEYTNTVTITGDITDWEAIVTDADGNESTSTVDVTVDFVANYYDDNIQDNTDGTLTHDIEITVTIAWTEDGTDKEVSITLDYDTINDPGTNEVTVTVNSRTFGPYSLTEFASRFNVEVLFDAAGIDVQ